MSSPFVLGCFNKQWFPPSFKTFILDNLLLCLCCNFVAYLREFNFYCLAYELDLAESFVLMIRLFNFISHIDGVLRKLDF